MIFDVEILLKKRPGGQPKMAWWPTDNKALLVPPNSPIRRGVSWSDADPIIAIYGHRLIMRRRHTGI